MNRLFVLVLLLLVAACTQQVSAPVATTTLTAEQVAAVRSLIGQTAEKYGRAISVRDVDAIMAFYTPDTWLFPPHAPVAKTETERRAYWESQQLPPGVTDSVGITSRISVAQSGELATEYGSFFQLNTDKKGNSVSTPHKYIASWEKQADGTWKVLADMWNTDQ